MNANTKYKDSVFSSIFSEPELLRELYCALAGVELPSDTPVEITTLQDVLFKDRINDIAFLIASKLIILIEHQSTINPNMALRLLLYAARLYEKIVEDKNLYSTKQIRIPRPEFFVLYNGIAPYPERQILKLSDMFECDEYLIPHGMERPALDLEVKVFNINEGRNVEVARRCSALAGYSAFVAKVREYQGAGQALNEAVKQAIKYCCGNDILKGYLEKHSSEVNNVLLTEWSWDDALAVSYEEGMERGIEKGIERGMEKGSINIAKKALSKGYSIDTIQELTGLKFEDITALQTK